jgi:copper chaperone NosL
MRLFAAAMLLVVGACAARAPSGPPEIRLGVDACEGCRMTISDARYAAAVAGELDGEPRVFAFDDIGCLARWEARTSAFAPRHRWVHDHSTGGWIDASVAVFGRSTAWATPMGSGLAAFAEVRDAGAGASPARWDGVLEMARAGELDAPLSSQPGEESP